MFLKTVLFSGRENMRRLQKNKTRISGWRSSFKKWF